MGPWLGSQAWTSVDGDHARGGGRAAKLPTGCGRHGFVIVQYGATALGQVRTGPMIILLIRRSLFTSLMVASTNYPPSIIRGDASSVSACLKHNGHIPMRFRTRLGSPHRGGVGAGQRAYRGAGWPPPTVRGHRRNTGFPRPRYGDRPALPFGDCVIVSRPDAGSGSFRVSV